MKTKKKKCCSCVFVCFLLLYFSYFQFEHFFSFNFLNTATLLLACLLALNRMNIFSRCYPSLSCFSSIYFIFFFAFYIFCNDKQNSTYIRKLILHVCRLSFVCHLFTIWFWFFITCFLNVVVVVVALEHCMLMFLEKKKK